MPASPIGNPSVERYATRADRAGITAAPGDITYIDDEASLEYWDGTQWMAVSGEAVPFELAITSPVAGENVPPVHDVLGTAAPGATVELHPVPGPADGHPVATTVAGEFGTFGFTGSTPAKASLEEWYVTANGEESEHVPVHVTEA